MAWSRRAPILTTGGIYATTRRDPPIESSRRTRADGAAGCTSKGWEARMDIESMRMDQARAGLPPHHQPRVDDPEPLPVVASHTTVIAGGGPAGLTAAYELT